MSVDIHWETLTTGPDGVRLAETVRAFIHEKFQQVTLPRFIRSVQVHSFDFGNDSPEIELKDICDPLPDFYEEDEDEDDADSLDSKNEKHAYDDDDDDAARINLHAPPTTEQRHYHESRRDISCENVPSPGQRSQAPANTRPPGIRDSLKPTDRPASPFFPTSQTPGIPGGMSNLTYFHLPFAPGLSGSTTPLAAVAGAHFQNGWPENAGNNLKQTQPPHPTLHQPSASGSSPTLSSAADPTSRPPSQHQKDLVAAELEVDTDMAFPSRLSSPSLPPEREQDPNDIQIIAHVKYSGNLRLSLTAEILLDYPMPSFVGIPLQLNITGLAFDGVAILAYIKKRAHVCFLSPEDAEAFAGESSDRDTDDSTAAPKDSKMGGLLQEIKVESEIGQKENGKQVLKNVGKVEKFVLDQVRRIFEDEFVYPSFWTFLV